MAQRKTKGRHAPPAQEDTSQDIQGAGGAVEAEFRKVQPRGDSSDRHRRHDPCGTSTDQGSPDHRQGRRDDRCPNAEPQAHDGRGGAIHDRKQRNQRRVGLRPTERVRPLAPLRPRLRPERTRRHLEQESL